MASHLPKVTAALVVMGVSGVGKTTIAAKLAEQLGRDLVEGDDLHPEANIAKMKQGIPLDDSDRLPWLKKIAARIDEARQSDEPIVVTCSALKRIYRETLEDGHDDVGFLYLEGSKKLIAERLAARKGHFMPPGLLDSQFATLEVPTRDEPSLAVEIDGSPDDIVRTIVEKLNAR